MSQRRLLPLFCLSLLFLLVVQLTYAGGELNVDESRTRFVLHGGHAEVLLAVENTTGKTRNATVKLELLDKNDGVLSEITATQSVAPGSRTLRFNLPPLADDVSEINLRDVIWYRLKYRMADAAGSGTSIDSGIISLSQIMPDLFEIRVATSDFAREGGRYRARVQALHPFTHRPAAGVQVKGEIVFEDDDRKSTASATTNKEGYALLDLVLPPNLSTIRGGLHVVGTRAGAVAKVEGEVQADNMVRTIITTDKTLYQPGQTMHIRALMLSAAKRALANQSIVIRVYDPEHVTVFMTTARSSRFGVVNADWPIPDNVRLGDYRIAVDREGDNYYPDFTVRISRYDLPNFSVNVEPDRGFYLPGQNAKVKVRADYLFGQPVKLGRVRVVQERSREWSYREQKWDINEGAESEGETDAQGVFVADVDLKNEHEDLGGWRDAQFKDLTYAAYFTDPTTNRTEQRRFTLRVTREAIHVYVVNNIAEGSQSPDLPLQLYVSTFYADGSPARCKVNVELVADEKIQEQGRDRRLRRTINTNRYGLAKTRIELDDHFDIGTFLTLQVRAADSQGRFGSAKLEEFLVDDEGALLLDTEKSLYSAGEPIAASITSSLPDQTLVVELAKDSNVIRSERVRLRGGRATVNFPYSPNFTGPITIAAYPDFAQRQRLIGIRTILFPTNSQLDLNVRTSQATYRPGEDASVRFNVRTSDGRTAASALGVVVFDKSVEERVRTDSEFGAGYQPHNKLLTQLLGLDVQLSGVTFRDLQRLDMTKPVSPDLDLLAEMLLNEYRQYYPIFFDSDEFRTGLASVFGSLIDRDIGRVYSTLAGRYERTLQHPADEKTMREFLREAGIDFQQLFDPWGMNYRADFATEGRFDRLTLWSGGTDKRFGTDDDFSVLRMDWEYFKPLGQAIQRILDSHHKRTGGFIRDRETLRQELAREGTLLEQNRDPWDQPYRFDFAVEQTNYLIKVISGGPNRRFGVDANNREDDVQVWSAQIDYFGELREKISQTLTDKLTDTGKFPQSESELREVLRDSEQPFETLRDPWNRSYYALFKTNSVDGVSAKLENRATAGSMPTAQVQMISVTRTIATVTLRSAGADGQQGTPDDFTVGSFSRVIAEQSRETQQREPVGPAVVLSHTNGTIYGALVDPNGAVIPNVHVTATRTPEIHRYRTSTDEMGEYVLKDLPPGSYEVRFEIRGFMTYVFTSVQVQVSTFTKIDVTMEPGALTEAVTITAQSSNLNLMTNASVAHSYSRRLVRMGATEKSAGSAAQISTPRLREYFPETLVWQPSVETDEGGRAEIKFKLADNITTWKMAVIGSTEDGRIGTAEKEFKAFQPFFVEHDPPRVLTEGDEISLPVVVRNYLDRIQKVDLEIKTENWFSLIGPARKQATVAAGDASAQTFDFRVVSSVDEGRQRITAFGGDANDAIEKPVSVHPDGEEVSATAGDLLTASASLELNLRDTAIPNSTRAELKIYPNLMAHVMESVEAIMQRPYGCGEQTISTTYPSLLLLRSYKQTGHEFPLRFRAKRYLNTGYTRLLNYRDEKGGFAYWSNGDPEIALTVYALRFLTGAATVMELDQNVIKDARSWLLSQQAADGSWPPHQFSDDSQGRNRAVLTAYVAHSLAATASKLVSAQSEGNEDRERDELDGSLKRALEYLGQQRNAIDEPYLLASYALALTELRDTARAKPVIDKLRAMALSDGDTAYWSPKTNTPFYGWGITGEIETTALVVQALSRYCSSAEGKCEAGDELAKRGLLFLLKHKDQYGVWFSTQATVNVLDTMFTLFATNKTGRDSGAGSEAQIVVNGRVAQTVKIPEARGPASPITVALTSLLSIGKNRIEIKRPADETLSSVQALATYYVPWTDKTGKDSATNLHLVAKFDKTESRIGDVITCHVEADRFGSMSHGMLLAEIGLPPGADVDRVALEAALKDRTITQYDILPDRVVLYLWPRGNGAKLDFQFRPRFGLAAKTAPSVIYDYYNPESRVVLPPVKFLVK